MASPVQGSASQPFSVLYQPGGTGADSARLRQKGQTSDPASARRADESVPSRSVQTSDDKTGSSGGIQRYASYDRDENGVVSASGGDQRRGSVLNITV